MRSITTRSDSRSTHAQTLLLTIQLHSVLRAQHDMFLIPPSSILEQGEQSQVWLEMILSAQKGRELSEDHLQ
jgi:hypothetical protein